MAGSRGSISIGEALLKLFFLALNNISKKWTMPLRDWKAALTRSTIQFEGRMPKDCSQPLLHKNLYTVNRRNPHKCAVAGKKKANPEGLVFP
jgi:hypothetical protein